MDMPQVRVELAIDIFGRALAIKWCWQQTHAVTLSFSFDHFISKIVYIGPLHVFFKLSMHLKGPAGLSGLLYMTQEIK